jgi:hypothetical protein
MLEEGDVPHFWDRFLLLGRNIHELFYRSSLEKMLFYEKGDIFDLELLIEDAFRLNHEDWPPLAESIASRRDDKDLILEVAFPDLLFESLFDFEGPAGNASGTGAD